MLIRCLRSVIGSERRESFPASMPQLTSALHSQSLPGSLRLRRETLIVHSKHHSSAVGGRPFTRFRPARKLTVVRAENTEKQEEKDKKQTERLVKGIVLVLCIHLHPRGHVAKRC